MIYRYDIIWEKENDKKKSDDISKVILLSFRKIHKIVTNKTDRPIGYMLGEWANVVNLCTKCSNFSKTNLISIISVSNFS
jgi:hypothetical protein